MLRPWRYPEARRRIARYHPKLDPPGIALIYVRFLCVLMYPAMLGAVRGVELVIKGEDSLLALLGAFLVSIPFIFMFIGYCRQASCRRFIIRFRYFWGISFMLSLILACIGGGALMAGKRMVVEASVIGLMAAISCWLSIRALRLSWSDTGNGLSGEKRSALSA